MTWLGAWLEQDVEVLNPSKGEDVYGNTRVTWASPSSTTERMVVQERNTSESTVGEQVVAVTGVAFAGTDSVVTETSRLLVDGITWDVTGVVPRHFAGRSHLEVQIRRDQRTASAAGGS